MSQQLVDALEHLAKEKGLDKETLMNTLRSAFLSATKKTFGQMVSPNMIEIKELENGQISVYWKKKVVAKPVEFFEIGLNEAKKINSKAELGQEIEVEFSPLDFTRNAAQTAKQIVIQRIKEAEREIIFKEFKKKEGDVVIGAVQKVSRNYITVELGKAEGILINKEQIKNERYQTGDRIKTYVVEVSKSTKGPRIKLSRSHPGLVRRLFELEIPEISDNIVEIKNIAREAGERTKIAVFTKNGNIDPVGACVGMKGTRVHSIMRELRGEKLDIIPWSENDAEFITRALGPAKISRVIIEKDKRRALVIVPNDQLSLAIGKKGQNARLSARLTNWRIDVKSEDEFKEVQRQTLSKLFKESTETEEISLTSIEGIGKKILERLKDAGLNSPEDIKKAGLEGLEAIDGIGKKTAEKILKKALKIMDKTEEESGDSESIEKEKEKEEESIDKSGDKLQDNSDDKVE